MFRVQKWTCYDTSLAELKAFTDLLHSAGISYGNCRNVKSLWKTSQTMEQNKKAVVDAKTSYASSSDVYSGTQASGLYLYSNKLNDVGSRLLVTTPRTHQRMTFNRWPASFQLTLPLLTEHTMTSGGIKQKSHMKWCNFTTENYVVQSLDFRKTYHWPHIWHTQTKRYC